MARGDRRGVVAVDYRGEVYAFSRWAGVKTKDIRARIGDLNTLPSVSEVKQQIAQAMTQKLKDYATDITAQSRKKLAYIAQQKRSMTEKHQVERQSLRTFQEKRWQEESLLRTQQFSKGWRNIWDRVNGKHKQIRHQNESDAKTCFTRDRREYQALIDQQRPERQVLQQKILRARTLHQIEIKQLRREMSHYIGMGSRGAPDREVKSQTRKREKSNEMEL